MTSIAVRRVREDDWPRVRALRIEAVGDPAAAIAFLSTPDQERAHDDEFWRRRTADTAGGRHAAQFIAEADGDWIGTATVLVRVIGSADHTGRRVFATRADVVGVYVRPGSRGSGAIDALFEAAARWAAESGVERLTLDVHVDNARAQAAYRRNGFVPTGETFTGPIGDELVMARAVSPAAKPDDMVTS